MVMDTLGIIRQMEADPALRAQLRAVLLSEEVLGLPATIRGLAEAQARTEARLEQLAARVEGLAEAQARTEARLEQLAARVEGLAEAQARTEARLEQLAAHLDQLERWAGGQFSSLRDDLAEVKGASLEERVRSNPRRFVPRALARSARLLAGEELDSLLDSIDEEVAAELERTDALVEARLAQGYKAVFVTEAAWAAHYDDVERAARRARALREAGVLARALVISHDVPAEAVLAFASESGVAVVSESRGLLSASNGD